VVWINGEYNTAGIVMFRAAEAIGMDPLEFQLKCVDPSPAKINCLQEGADRFGWKTNGKDGVSQH